MHKRLLWPVTPKADPDNMVTYKNWRFTVLTQRLIRIEYDPRQIFENRASQTVFHRNFPKTEFAVSRGDTFTLKTAELHLCCGEDLESLTICLHNWPNVWHYGDVVETLGGTTSTLDRVDGRIGVDAGICSRGGYAVLDDSDRMVLTDGWVDVRAEGTKDLYFFGYKHDYIGAVQDFCRLTGVPPLLPAYALGNWWSRFHAYTQQEYLDLMEKFKQEDVPFSVAVVDMDWHITQHPDGRSGWTGYTWNKELFPNYKQFLKDIHKYNLKTALNLHPAEGVRDFEDMYPQMCKALGRPADGSPCKFDILDPDYMEKYFDVIHHPYERDGVDFWWMDWQQGKDYWWIHQRNVNGQMQDPREVLDPLWLLNHLHILDISRNGKRPMFFSRYSGPGSQRYPVGFSGDTAITWESLDFQPEFTATSSNIGYGWWSHDIGGHHFGYRDDNLTARWVQLGVFSPINRLHSTSNPFINKEPWDYNETTQRVMRSSLKLRHQLFPYLYTMNYRTHTQCKMLVMPMYYTHPECQSAYEVKNQYWFGDQMIVAPITRKNSAGSLLGHTRAWLPQGVWTDFFTGRVYDGLQGRMLDLYRDDKSIPVLCKAGAIVPLQAHRQKDNRLGGAKKLEIMVFPGADNTFTLYEDAGDGEGYRRGASVTTQMDLRYTDQQATFTIAPAQGMRSLIPQVRQYAVLLRGFAQPETVTVAGNPAKFSYDPSTHTIRVEAEAAVSEGVTICVSGSDLCNRNTDVLQQAVEILKRSQTGMTFKEEVYNKLLKPHPVFDRFVSSLYFCISTPGERDTVAAIMELYLLDREYRR
ncbi:MAG: DUF5110 domain-containing protein [Oscillospiraceae bacterium]|nr:DUF5110 domain-containing protein [Oscillospiraceae bacterium]